MTGMTSSVTATMRSPEVVLITFRCRMFFSATHSPNTYLVRSRLIDTDLSSLQIGRISLDSKLRTRVDRSWKTSVSYEIRILRLSEGEIVTKNTRLFIGSCRNVDFSSDEQCPIF